MFTRIIVFHLDQYFTDQRRCSKLYIDERFKTINDLQEYIRNIFIITSKFCLLDISTYSLLPRNESIKILEGVDHVIVQQVAPDFKINTEKENSVLEKPELQNNALLSESNDNIFPQCREEKRSISTKMVPSVNRGTIYDNIKKPLKGNSIIDVEMMPPVEDVEEVAEQSSLTAEESSVRKSSLPIAEPIARKSSLPTSDPIARKSNLTKAEPFVRKSSQHIVDSVTRKSSLINVASVETKNTDKMVNYESQEMLQSDVDKPKFIIHSVETVNLPTVMEGCEEELNNGHGSAMENGYDAENSICGSATKYPENVTTRTKNRVRKRKRSSKPHTPISLTKDVNLLRKAVDVCIKRPSRASHIRFDEVDEQLDSSFRSDIESNQVDSLLLSETKNSSFNLSAIADIRRKPKIVQGFSGNKENIPDTNNQNVDETRSSAWEDLLKEFNPHDYPNITELPVQDDIIAFRMVKMSDNYEPVLSKYIFAIVLNVEKRGQIQDSNFKLQVLAGIDNCKQPTGKFDLPEDLMDESANDNSILFIKWVNILEPKKII